MIQNVTDTVYVKRKRKGSISLYSLLGVDLVFAEYYTF